MRRALLMMVVGAISFACSPRPAATVFPNGQWIDLTHDFGEDTIYWVNAEPFEREGTEGMTPKGFYYAAGNYSAAEHGGTHIDAPFHFAEGKNTVDQIGLDQLIAPAIKIDVTEKAAADRDYLIVLDDIIAWENKNGEIPAGSIILFQTGFGKFWPDKMQYLGTDERGDAAVKDLHFPGLDKEAAEWLIRKRPPKAVGIDTASIDYGQSTDFKTHVALMMKNVPAFENVANLDKLPAKGFHILGLPMKIKGGSGAPLRIVALIPARE